MSQVSFPYTTFTDPSGNPLADGYVLINVNVDVQSPSGLLCGGMSLRVDLNGSGVMESIPNVWPNSFLLPGDSYYVLRTYSSDGQLASGPDKVTV